MGVSIQDVAIIRAHKNDSLELVETSGRFGKYVYLADDKGIIECFEDKVAAQAAIDRALVFMIPEHA
jgi:hypothetical protein